MKTPRRRFVTLLTFGTAASMIAGKLRPREVLAFCDPLAGQTDAVLKLRLSDSTPCGRYAVSMKLSEV